MQLQEIITHIEQLAPPGLQESWDNSGLIVGDRTQEVHAALLCLDVTENTINEAVATGCDLIVSHHPIIFRGIKHLTTDNYAERCLRCAIKHDIAIYAAHTSLDSAPHGVSRRMADLLHLNNVTVLHPQQQALQKIVTFVPTAHLEQVRNALFDAGAGHIGNYDRCSYSTNGHGTFRAGNGTHPFCGNVGQLHTEPEDRLEVIVPKMCTNAVVRALIASHPYEEPAFDIIPLNNTWSQVGLGVIGTLSQPINDKAFITLLRDTFHAKHVRHTPCSGRRIQRIALCSGSGSEFITDALTHGADAYATADVSYHHFFEHENRLLIADVGHYETEICTKQLFMEQLAEKIPNFAIHLAQSELPPAEWD